MARAAFDQSAVEKAGSAGFTTGRGEGGTALGCADDRYGRLVGCGWRGEVADRAGLVGGGWGGGWGGGGGGGGVGDGQAQVLGENGRGELDEMGGVSAHGVWGDLRHRVGVENDGQHTVKREQEVG